MVATSNLGQNVPDTVNPQRHLSMKMTTGALLKQRAAANVVDAGSSAVAGCVVFPAQFREIYELRPCRLVSARSIDMAAALKIVIQLPLQELWREDGFVTTARVRWLTADDVANLLRVGRVQFVAAALSLLFFGACAHQPARRQITFTGAVRAGDHFNLPFGERFNFKLEPSDFGWTIVICERGREENLSRLTPPFHFVSNPRDIEGWHFRNALNTGPDDGSVNAFQDEREFVFSPEVGRSIDGPAAPWSVSPEEVERVSSFGRGMLRIEHLVLSPVQRGGQASIVEMDFRCTISWPNEFSPDR